MKRILIITTEGSSAVSWIDRQAYLDEFCNNIEKLLSKTTVYFTALEDITCRITDSGTEFVDTKNGFPLSYYHFVQFKNWKYDIPFSSVIARYCNDKNIPFINQEVGSGTKIGKLAQAYIFSKASLPSPDTLYISRDRLIHVTKVEFDSYGFNPPYIMKQVDGSRGVNNFLCQSLSQMKKLLKADYDEKRLVQKQYIIQEYIPNDGDYRILFFGTQNPPLIFKRTSVSGSHLNNTSRGGESMKVDNGDIPKEYIDHARKAAQLMNCEIAGVDIIVNRGNGRHYILEVNSAPAVATGFMVDDKAKRFVKYVENILEENAR